jgi:DNA-binding CsgD family transcriptional regulator
MTGPRPAGRRWTAVEEIQLLEMLAAGMTGPEIARKLKRTTHAIYSQLRRHYRKTQASSSLP